MKTIFEVWAAHLPKGTKQASLASKTWIKDIGRWEHEFGHALRPQPRRVYEAFYK